MKKVITGAAAVALLFGAVSISSFAAGSGHHSFRTTQPSRCVSVSQESTPNGTDCRYIDSDQNGVCDNCLNPSHDGICNFTDDNHDGICDNYSTGNHHQRNMRHGHGCH